MLILLRLLLVVVVVVIVVVVAAAAYPLSRKLEVAKPQKQQQQPTHQQVTQRLTD